MRMGPRAGRGTIVDRGSCLRRLAATVAGVMTRVSRLVPMQIWSAVEGPRLVCNRFSEQREDGVMSRFGGLPAG